MQEDLHFLTAQTEMLDWLEVQLFLKEELKFVSTMPGGVSVNTGISGIGIPGVLPVQVLSVASWDFSELVSAMHCHTLCRAMHIFSPVMTISTALTL
jgi:hypothetical protein